MVRSSNMARSRRTVGFIGGGNMAEALIRGLIDSGNTPASIHVSEPMAARRRVLKRRFRVNVSSSNLDVCESADVVFLAVKPQIMGEVLEELQGKIGRRQLVVSIAAGVPLKRLEKGLGGDAKVVRVMPNTPCLLGRGASVLCGGRKATSTDLRFAKSLFETVGLAEVVGQEKLLDAVTGLSGSGPAYVYLFAESLIDGGVRAGLDRDLAAKLAFQTIAGAAEMMLETGRPPADLRKAVSSPGGTTLAGLARLAKGRFAQTVGAAVAAATRRSKELGRSG
jgi:pyrroline-5-carboxylate reductase